MRDSFSWDADPSFGSPEVHSLYPKERIPQTLENKRSASRGIVAGLILETVHGLGGFQI
jgi:hypothetical protein